MVRLVFQLVLLCACLASLHAQDAAGLEFFEKRVRPVLAEKCYACHGPSANPVRGGLRLDTAAGLLSGGDSGPAIAPGDPNASLLLRAVSYTSLDLRMPPTGKLADEEIAALKEWIAMGAPDPRAGEAPVRKAGSIDLERGRRFWAFRPVERPAVPQVKDSAWPLNPVDRFLLARMEKEDYEPAPPAAKRDLLRRVTFDLTGLPPTPEEVASFLNDSSPDAYEKVVERLLASPHYGERWARHWLDLVRFAETNGHEFDNDKLDAWRYRDYVIRALNEDVPYDQFVREHVAGDLLPEPRLSRDRTFLESPLATAFFWFGEVLNSATDSIKSKADDVDNQIDVLGKTFLGLTTACARCHDHKFDPIPTADYYALAGVLHSTGISETVIDSAARRSEIRKAAEELRALEAEAAALVPAGQAPAPDRLAALSTPEAREKMKERGDEVFAAFTEQGFPGWKSTGEAFGKGPVRRAPVWQPLVGSGPFAASFGPGSDRFTGSLTSQEFRMPKLWVHVYMGGTPSEGKTETNPLRVTVVADGHKSAHLVVKEPGRMAWHSARMTKEINRLCYFEIVDRSTEGHLAVGMIVISDSKEPPEYLTPAAVETAPFQPSDPERWRQIADRRKAIEARIPPSQFAMTAVDHHPHDVRLHIRGNHKNLGDPVPRGFLRVVDTAPAAKVTGGSGRLELARWLTHPDHPLVARVLVNRVWKHHFGEGLVRSVDNFGLTGERPSHPELLDWLASEFVNNGWSIKNLHRLMVLSRAYKMSSESSAKAATGDPLNVLLTRMPVRRLEGEAVRDAILAVSGELDPAVGGPSVMPHISKYQDGRGKPKSGPLDANGRRSIYIQVRRNFLTPMLLAFDYPLPTTTIGKRGVSTVPSQALLLLNNEFVTAQAQAWAERLLKREEAPEARLARMYEKALARPPQPWELQEMTAFVIAQQSRHQSAGAADPRKTAWADVAHVLFNSAEFLYLP